jgi:hypothetical protein
MVANVQHMPVNSLPIPPEGPRSLALEPEIISESLSQHTSSSDGKGIARTGSPLARATLEMNAAEIARRERTNMTSPISAQSQSTSISSAASSRRFNRGAISPQGRSAYSGTTFSLSSPVQVLPETPLYSANSMTYASTTSLGSARSYRGGSSRLRHEFIPSPVDKPLVELFPFTRGRLNDVPYKAPRPVDSSADTPEALRRQMLRVVFGWDGDIADLIRDECKFERSRSRCFPISVLLN